MHMIEDRDFWNRPLTPAAVEDEVVQTAWDAYLAQGGTPTLATMLAWGGDAGLWRFDREGENLCLHLSMREEGSPADGEIAAPTAFSLPDLPEPDAEFPHICGGPGKRLLAIAGNGAFCDDHGAEVTFPTDGMRYTCGFFPRIGVQNPFLGAATGVTEAIAKQIARGTAFADIALTPSVCFSLQQDSEEEEVDSAEVWLGRNVAAALGLRCAVKGYGLPVHEGARALTECLEQPTAITVAQSAGKAQIPGGFTAPNHAVCLFAIPYGMDGLPIFDAARHTWARVTQAMDAGQILSAQALGAGGLAEALGTMCLPGDIGFVLSDDIDIFEIGRQNYGAIVVEAEQPLPGTVTLGQTIDQPVIRMNKCADTPLSILRDTETK